MTPFFHVVGVLPQDDRWRKMKAIWDACKIANIKLPSEVSEYFGEDACNAGPTCDIKAYEDPHGDYVSVAVKDIPKGVDTIRFKISY